MTPASRRSWHRWVRWGSPAVADQVLSSGAQLLLVVLVARESTAEQFGAFSVALLVHGFALGCVRALVGDIAVIRCRRSPTPATETRAALFLAGGFGLGCALVLGVVAIAVGGDIGTFLVLFALATPVVHGQDVLRSVAYGRERVGDAVLFDGTWLLVQGAGTTALLLTGQASAVRLVVVWLVGAAVSLAVAVARYRAAPAFRGSRWIEEDGSRALGFVGDYLVSTGVVQGSFVVLAAVLPLDEFGALRLAFVSVSPLANLLAGVRSLVLARLAGADYRTARHTARWAAMALGVVALAYGAVVTLAPESAGVAVFGSVWEDARAVVGLVALGELFRIAAFPAIDLLRVFASASRLVRTRVTTSWGVVLGVVGGGVLGGPGGAALGTAVALAVANAVWWWRATSLGADLARERRRSPSGH